MKRYGTAQLTPSIVGWRVHTADVDGRPILGHIMGYENYWQYARQFSHESFLKGRPIDEAKAHFKAKAKKQGVSISFCGKPNRPTIQMWMKE